MKSIFLLLLLLCLTAKAADVILKWDANTETDIAGYKIYYGTESGIHILSMDAGNVTTATITGLQSGLTYYFTATAYNAGGLESLLSDEIQYTVPVPIPPPAPIVLTHDAAAKSLRWSDPIAPAPPQVTTYVVQHAVPGGQWADAATVQGNDYSLPATLPAGEHRYRVATLVQGKPGEWSNVLTLAVPAPPQRLRIVSIQMSGDMKTWQEVAKLTVPELPNRTFYQLTFTK